MNDFIETFGASYKFSDHKPGETITYRLDDQEYTGEILHVQSPGRTITGAPHTLLYIVERSDAGDSFPDFVAPSEVVAAAAASN